MEIVENLKNVKTALELDELHEAIRLLLGVVSDLIDISDENQIKNSEVEGGLDQVREMEGIIELRRM